MISGVSLYGILIRGGYDQRSLPGRFEPNHPALFEKRIVNVMELASLDKWEAAIGPIGPLCKSIDRIQTRKEKHYEDKFMCSFYDLIASSHCNIMSIGSNDQWGFETKIVSGVKTLPFSSGSLKFQQ